MKTIAIDIDDTLTPFTPYLIRASHEKFGTNPELEARRFDDFYKAWGVDLVEAKQRRSDMLSGFDDSIFYKDAVDVLKRIGKDSRLIVLTSRPEKMVSYTESWINLNFPGIFDDIIFAQQVVGPDRYNPKKDNKGQFCPLLEFDYLIDDQIKHCEGVAKHGRQALLFGDYFWNRDLKPNDKIVRVYDWNGVAKYFCD